MPVFKYSRIQINNYPLNFKEEGVFPNNRILEICWQYLLINN